MARRTREQIAADHKAMLEYVKPEIPFPHVNGQGTVLRMNFVQTSDRELFQRWLVKHGGWAAFGDYADGQP